MFMKRKSGIYLVIVFLFFPIYKLSALNRTKKKVNRNIFNANETPQWQTGFGVGYKVDQYVNKQGTEVTVFLDYNLNDYFGLNLSHWLNVTKTENRPFFNIGIRFYPGWVDKKISFPIGW